MTTNTEAPYPDWLSEEAMNVRREMHAHYRDARGCTCHLGPDLCPEGAQIWERFSALRERDRAVRDTA